MDLARVTTDDIAALKLEHFWLGCTVEQSRQAWAEALTPGRMTVVLSDGNGGHPVLTLGSPAFDPSRPFVVQTHFHGDFTAVGAPGGVHTLHIRERLVDDPQRVWVLPEAAGNIGRKGTDWSQVKDHAALVSDALRSQALSARDDTRFVVSAHSAGGRALAAVLGNGTLRAEQLVLLDALYERHDGPGAFSAILAAVRGGALAQVEDLVLVSSGAYPVERDRALLEAAGKKARQVPLVPRPGLSDHAATARHHLSLPLPPRGRGSG